MSELRQRPTAKASKESDASQPRQQLRDEPDHGISLLDVIRVIAILVVGSLGLSYYMTDSESVLWGYRPWYTRWPVVKQWVVRSFRVPREDKIPLSITDTDMAEYSKVQ